MELSELRRIKSKIQSVNPQRWRGDDFDVRFYLISQLKTLKNSKILDVDGGIGIICSEIPESNFVVNSDISFKDLLKARGFLTFENFSVTMTDLPFSNSSFDYVIYSHLIEVAKYIDLQQNNPKFPTIEKMLSEINRVLKNGGLLILTTPNNEFYKTEKLDYNELKNSLKNHFTDISLKFFNTYPKLSSRYRKLNLANVIPKLLSKITEKEKILNNLLRQDKGKSMSSVSFYVEARKI
ncbi:MAG: class I SAM-dependent methyltransferase [Nitrosopumilaceae archaeon]